MVEVRRILPVDWPQLRELRLEALKDSPFAFVEQYDESLTQPDSFWQERAGRASDGADRATFIAVAGLRFVGMVACFVEDDVTDVVSAHIVGVYVTPAQRGTGVADRLIEAAVSWAETVPTAGRIRLFVTDGNARAASFYRRLGFVETGATMPYPPDPRVLEYEMEYRP